MANNLEQLMKYKQPVRLFNGKHSDFSLYDFYYSNVAITFQIDNIPSNPEIVKNIKYLINDVLQPIYNMFGPLEILKGYVSVSLAKILDHSLLSSHCFGQGVEIHIKNKNVSSLDFINYIATCLSYNTLTINNDDMALIKITYRHRNNNKVIKFNNYGIVDVVDLNYVNKTFNYVSTGQF